MYQFPLTPDQVIQFHGEIVSHAGLRAFATAGILQVPTVFEISIAVSGNPDDAEQWKFRLRAVGENDDDLSFILPNDYNASTNNNIWCRIG